MNLLKIFIILCILCIVLKKQNKFDILIVTFERSVFMKKFISFLLIFTMIFSASFCINVYAEDVNVDAGGLFGKDDPYAPKFTVSVEEGVDAGYITKGANFTYTAVPYNGNEFLGWYVGDELSTTDTVLTLQASDTNNYVAKFKDNNILAEPNGGFENGTVGTNLIGTSWGMVATDTWRDATVTDTYSKSGDNSLALDITFQNDIYVNLTGLEKNTYYKVSYYWMLPYSVITDTATANDGYFGSVVTTTDVDSIVTAYDTQNLGGDYDGSKKTNFVGGQWNKTEYVFNSGDNTDLRMFIKYDGDIHNNTFKEIYGTASPNTAMYIDEFTVYRPEDQESVATYKINVDGEKTYAHVSHSAPVAHNTEVWAVAAPEGGYAFEGWYNGDVLYSTEKLLKINATENLNLVAKSVPAVDEYIPDVDESGTVNLNDLVSLAQFVAKWDVAVDTVAANVNGEGEADLADVTLLAKYLAGWDVEEQMADDIPVLPADDTTKENILAGTSDYFNKSTVVNEGNKARIANVLKKAVDGEKIKIVAFGGSITEGSGATNKDNCYASKVADWFENQFGADNVELVNAGIGSTTSLVGVHRMAEDVLAESPDFVIVDFTVNDQNDTMYCASYEAVIRRLLEEDIAVLSIMFGGVDGSGYSPVHRWHLPTLTYYDIPTIDFYSVIRKYVTAGTIGWYDVINTDNVHPTDAGHLVAASAINAYLADVLDDIDSISTEVPILPADCFFTETNTYIGANFLTAEPTENTGFTTAKVHGNHIDGYVCTNGGTIKFTANQATSVSVFLQNKSGNGTATIYINGVAVRENISCDSSATNGFIWVMYNELFDAPKDITVEIVINGAGGLAPIGVSYVQ